MNISPFKVETTENPYVYVGSDFNRKTVSDEQQIQEKDLSGNERQLILENIDLFVSSTIHHLQEIKARKITSCQPQ